ncbi:MAG: preprotein translocase subunit SecY [Anaerolineae bacterium]
MIEALRNAWKLPDLRRRLLYTLLILVVFRLASNIPVPGVDRLALQQLLAGGSPTGQVLNLLDMLSGGAVANFSVLAAGVSPYVTATLVLQLLVPIFPRLEETLREEGEEGQRRMNQWTFFLTVPLALLYSFGLAQSLSAQANILPNFGLGQGQLLTTATVLVTMTAGTMFAVWLGELITEQGIGNGLSLIIFGGIVSRVPANVAQIWAGDNPIVGLIVFVAIMVLTMLVIVYVQEGERRIKVQYGKRVRGMKVYGGGTTYIPLKVNTAGMIPLIFAQSILSFPAVIAQFFVASNNPTVQRIAASLVEFFSGSNPYYVPLYFLAVVGFTYFYTDVMVQQQNLPEMLQRQGGFIPGVRPGKRTEIFINSVYRRITLVGALFLGMVAVLPFIVGFVMDTNVMLIGSSGLLIVVGVVVDTMRQLEAQLLMRHYEGFLR